MSLRNAFSGGRLIVRPLSELGLTARFAASLSTSGIGATVRPTVDLDTVADRFISSLGRGTDPMAGDWNKIPWCLWNTRPAVAEHDVALNAVLDRVVRMQRRRPYRQLASAYLTDFAPDRPRLDRVANVLASCASAAGIPWNALHVRYDLFSGMGAAARLARIALNKETNVQGFFASIGLGGALAEAGFAEAVHGEGLKNLSTAPIASAAERLDVIRRWCLRPDDTLIFATWRAEMARAIVHPFGDRVPMPTDRDLILGFLVSRFGDPRVNRAAWIGMDDVADVLKRWLTEQSLRQFFDVLDKIAQPSHWRFRRAFWQAYHDAKLIQNAWVVFGPDGAAEARRSFGRDIRFGTFRSGGRKQVQKGHAVLLMDMGQCIVADWSHNGYCNIWAASDPDRPRSLNADSYTTSDVGRPPPRDLSEANVNRHDMFSHGGSDSYTWQDRVARRIQELTGVRVPQSAYRIR